MTDPPNTPQRHSRAIGVSAFAVCVIVVAGALFLRPGPSSQTTKTSTGIDVVGNLTGEFSYHFVTPSVGWAVDWIVVDSGDTTPRAAELLIYKTVDGAKTWSFEFTDRLNIRGSGVPSIQFVDPSHGFISVGIYPMELYRTVDGGAHWAVVALPDIEADVITFSDPLHGWLLAPTFHEKTFAQRLYATADGGDRWQQLPDAPPDLNDLSFRDSSTGWGGSREARVPHVYNTIDAGLTWHRHDLPPPIDGSQSAGILTTVKLVPGDAIIAILDAGQGPAYALSSTGGTAWAYADARPGGATSPLTIAFQDTFHWWAIDGPSLYKSSDAGKTWVHVGSDNLVDGAYIATVLDANNAWAYVIGPPGTGLELTSDGGLHWTRANQPAH